MTTETEARANISSEATRQRVKLQQQRNQLSRDLRSTIRDIRQAEQIERRKRDLPLTKPSDTDTATMIKAAKQEASRVESELDRLDTEINTAEASALEDIKKQVAEQEANLEELRRLSAEAQAALGTPIESKDVVILDKSGEAIDRATFNSLSTREQKLLHQLGIDRFNHVQERDFNLFKQQNFQTKYDVEHGTGIWLPKSVLLKLKPLEQAKLMVVGAEEFNKIQEHKAEAFKRAHTEIETKKGTIWLANDDWNDLTPQEQHIVKTQGLEGLSLEGHTPTYQFAFLQQTGRIPKEASMVYGSYNKDGNYIEGSKEKGEWSYSLPHEYLVEHDKEYYNIFRDYLFNEQGYINLELWGVPKNKIVLKTVLTTGGIDYRATWNKLTEKERLELLKHYKEPGPQSYWESIKEQWINMGEWVIPGLYLARHWDDLSTAEKGINVAIDLLFVGTVLGKSAGAAARAYTKASAVAATATTGRITVEKVERLLAKLRTAIKSGKASTIKNTARELHNFGNVMVTRRIPGGAEIRALGKVYIDRAVELGKVAKVDPAKVSQIAERMEIDLLKVEPSFTQAMKAQELAYKSGNAHRALQRSLKSLPSPRVGEAFSRISSEVVANAQKSMQADKAFLEKFTNLTSATPKQIKKIAKLANWPELQTATEKLASAERDLLKIWKEMEQALVDYKKLQKAYNRLERIKNPNAVQQASMVTLQNTLNNHALTKTILAQVEKTYRRYLDALDYFEDIAKPRWQDRVAKQIEDVGKAKVDRRLLEKRIQEWLEKPSVETKDAILKGIEPSSTSDAAERWLKTERSLQRTEPKFWEWSPEKKATAIAEKAKVQTAKPKPKTAVIKEVKPKVKSRFPSIETATKTAKPVNKQLIDAAIISRMGKTLSGTDTETAYEILHKAIEKGDVDTLTLAAIKAAVRELTGVALQETTLADALAKVDAKTAALTQLNAKTRVAVASRVKLAIRQYAKRHVFWPAIIIPLPSGSSRRLTEKERAGAVGWKQGIMYKMIYPPYGKRNIVNSCAQIKGIPYYAGAKSAYQSLVRLKGASLPPVIYRDMGIMDIEIRRGKVTSISSRAKPSIRFVPDKTQSTKTTPTIGGVHR